MSIVTALVDTYKKLKRSNILAGSPHPLDVARGKVAGARQAQIEGYTKGIINGTRDVSELGVNDIPIPSLAGETMQVVSTSANDTDGGSGIHSVIIEYIEPITEVLKSIEVALSGTTAVTIPVPIAFVSDMYTKMANNLNVKALGDITIFNGANIYNKISIGGNKSLTLFRYIPKNKNFYVTSLAVSGNSKAISIRLRANITDNLTSLDTFITRAVEVSAEGACLITFDPPMVIIGGHYLKASSFSETVDSNGIVSVGLNGWLEQKDTSTLNR